MGWIMTDWEEISKKYTNWWVKNVLRKQLPFDKQGLSA